MIENAEKFFERYRADETLRRRVLDAEAMYPGSLEIREAVAENVLLPIAADMGLPFTLQELRAYETRVKLRRARLNEPLGDDEPVDDDPVVYWLLDHGWEINEERLREAAGDLPPST